MEVSPVVTADEAGHRTIVVALDTETESLRALDWVTEQFYKPGDIVHMVHVCKCLSAPLEVFHGTCLNLLCALVTAQVYNKKMCRCAWHLLEGA